MKLGVIQIAIIQQAIQRRETKYGRPFIQYRRQLILQQTTGQFRTVTTSGNKLFQLMTESLWVPNSIRCSYVFCAVNQGIEHTVVNNQQRCLGKNAAAPCNFIAQMRNVVFCECWGLGSVQYRNKLNTIAGEAINILPWRNFQLIAVRQRDECFPEF